jgi:hypothetical protein
VSTICAGELGVSVIGVGPQLTQRIRLVDGTSLTQIHADTELIRFHRISIPVGLALIPGGTNPLQILTQGFR